MRDYVDKITNKFLAWQLPQSVCSDACVTDSSYIYARTGTNLLNFTEARLMVVHLFSELLDEHENLQKFATQYENQCVDLKSDLTAAHAEIARMKEENARLDKHSVDHAKFCDKLDQERLDMISKLQSALDAAVEGLKECKRIAKTIEGKGTVQAIQIMDVVTEATSSWQPSALDKIKKIREQK